jgi:hypothetical protein
MPGKTFYRKAFAIFLISDWRLDLRAVMVGMLSTLAFNATAAEILALDVVKKDQRILVSAAISVLAPPADVYAALIDYDNFSNWSQRYRDTGYVEPALDGRPQVQSYLEGCVLFFCRTVGRVAVLDLEPTMFIRATADPALSDVHVGVEEWYISAIPGGSLVRYSHDVEFKFWMPPVVGVWGIKRSLNRDAMRAAQQIELIAQGAE